MFNEKVKVILNVILVIVVVGLLAALAYAWWRTYKSERSPNQATFRAGTAEVMGLDGDYKGFVTGYNGSWQGKSLRGSEGRGINRFKDGDAVGNKYPFAFYVAPGLRDKNQDVIRLDYNQPGNPWWLRLIVDEMVKTAPDTYLGKVHIRVGPGLVFTMGYFTLTK